MKNEKEIRFLLLLSSYVLGSAPTKAQVLDLIEDKEWAHFSAEEQKNMKNRNEIIWRNSFAFVRLHLVLDGLYVDGLRNNWEITSEGIEELKRLLKQVLSEKSFSYITSAAIENARSVLCQ